MKTVRFEGSEGGKNYYLSLSEFTIILTHLQVNPEYTAISSLPDAGESWRKSAITIPSLTRCSQKLLSTSCRGSWIMNGIFNRIYIGYTHHVWLSKCRSNVTVSAFGNHPKIVCHSNRDIQFSVNHVMFWLGRCWVVEVVIRYCTPWFGCIQSQGLIWMT